MPIFDSWSSQYKTKFGAIPCGTACEFYIDLNYTGAFSPTMLISHPDGGNSYIDMEYCGGGRFKAAFTPKKTGLYFYHFDATFMGQRKHITKKDGHFGDFDASGNDFQLTVYDENYKTPDFIKGKTMYQIFPDRFFKSGKTHKNVPADRELRTDWGGVPNFRPDSNGQVTNSDYFGGDLAGIEEKLGYIKSLGVSCIYLNPIFEAHENHRYNTADYSKIDPLLGTEADFKRLCKKASELGIKIILDGVFSHTGADSVYFNKNNRYNSVGAYNSQESPYYSWYNFYNYPDRYESWWGFPTLPNVKETDPAYLEYICGENGILAHWLKAGASGFRLDVADELPDGFLDELRKRVKACGEENLIIGEVWEDASNKESYGKRRKYLLGEQLDGVMNYPFKEAILDYMTNADGEDFTKRIMSIVENYPKPSVDVLMNSLSTHDTARAITAIMRRNRTEPSKEEQSVSVLSESEYETGIKLMKCATVLQFFLPGVPCIYYGDEIGMQGWKDPFNRRCLDWGKENEEILEFTREVSAIRNSHPCLAKGKYIPVLSTGNTNIFMRYDDELGEGILIYLNKSHFSQEFLPTCGLMGDYTAEKLIRGKYLGDKIVVEPFDYAVFETIKKS